MGTREWTWWCVPCALFLCACLDRELAPLNPCLSAGVSERVDSRGVDKVDLLFMVDNSVSMDQEQAKLRAQFPKLISTLTTGMRNGKPAFTPVRDLHIAVVSSDLGTPGVTAGGCSAMGDDGALQHASNPTHDPSLLGCKPSYPSFLTFQAASDDPNAIANDFACIATLGTNGCGYEQQLESVLKALWPVRGIDPSTMRVATDDVSFLGGNGNTSVVMTSNANDLGFLRNDPQDPALLAIILVTDEDDCSAKSTEHFATSYNGEKNVNVRCHNYKSLLHDPQRYIDHFKRLRPAHPELVLFAAITGVPPTLVERAASVSFEDAAARDAYYDEIQASPDMQEKLDADQNHLVPSCTSSNGGEAYPPRRIVEVARGFGELGVVQSICQETFEPAMDAIIELISSKLPGVCLPRPLVRNNEGVVECNVVWELAAPSDATATLRACEDRPFLSRPASDHAQKTEQGNPICVVKQVPVEGNALLASGASGIEGWYYDTFTPELLETCKDTPQRVAFTDGARPPVGVSVRLECFDEAQRYVSNRNDVDPVAKHAEIGDACAESVDASGRRVVPDRACWVPLLDKQAGSAGDGIDRAMFCHPIRNVCVKACSRHDECPPAWVCDDRDVALANTKSTLRDASDLSRMNGSAICVNPTCARDEDIALAADVARGQSP